MVSWILSRAGIPHPSRWGPLFFFVLAACSDSTGSLLAFWEANLVPIRPSLVGGRIVAVTQAGKTDVGININNADPDEAYGWRVDSGTCDLPGTIQGGPAAYPPLIPSQGGSASAETSVAALFRPGREFAGKVFRSTPGGEEVVVACGNLEETSG